MLSQSKRLQLKNDYEDWWEHRLNRPIISVTLLPAKPVPYGRSKQLELCYDRNTPVEEVARAYHEDYKMTTFLGDAFPFYYQRVTGILGAYLGQKYTVSKENATVWFHELGKPLEDIHITFDRDYWFYQRSLDLMKAFSREMGPDLGMGIPDLGGMMDIFESMRGANNSLMDLYDSPDEVLRIRNEIYNAYETIVKEQIDRKSVV